jgi:AraC-like DNA-binding protein
MLKIVISTIPMFVCAFWGILLLLEYKSRNKAKVFLGLYMFVAFLLYLGHTTYFNRDFKFFGFWDNIYVFCSLAVYPLYFIYLKLISRKMSLELKDFWVLIPSVLMLLFSFLIYMNMTENEINIFTRNILYDKFHSNVTQLTPLLSLEIIKIRIFKIVFFIQLIPIVYFGRKYILDYNKRIRNYYSDTEGKTLQHFNNLLYIFIVTSLASSAANIVGKSFFAHSVWLLLIPALIFGFLLFIIGYLGYKQEFTLQSFLTDVKSDEIKSSQQNDVEINNDYNDNNKTRLLDEFYNLLEKEEIYKKTDLRITDISKKLNTNRTYISKIVNEELKTNFCDLINNYRIEHSKKLLKENDCKSMGLSQIGELSGFKSDSSFYRIFKEKEGLSPGDFRKIKYNC